LIEDNHITAITCGIYTGGATCNLTNSVIKHNTICGGTSTQVVTGIAADTHVFIAENFITASSDAISGATATQTVGNHVINNVTGALELVGT
jgi:hypothetical protein